MKKTPFIGFILLLFLMTNTFANIDSEIIFPKVELVNKTISNSIIVTETLPILPQQKISEVVLKSDEYTIFKQRQAGDYILLTVVNFDENKFLSQFYKMILSFHSENSAEFAFYDMDNKLILNNINIKKDKDEKIDLDHDNKEDIVLGYLGYDVNKLPAFKVKAYLPEGTLYHKGHFCQLEENKEKYKCYKEDPETGNVAEIYEVSAADLLTTGSTIEEEVQSIVQKEAQEKKIQELNITTKEPEVEKVSTIGDKTKNNIWQKIGLFLIILMILIIIYIKHKSIKNKTEESNDYGGHY